MDLPAFLPKPTFSGAHHVAHEEIALLPLVHTGVGIGVDTQNKSSRYRPGPADVMLLALFLEGVPGGGRRLVH